MMTYDLRWRIVKGLILDSLFIWVIWIIAISVLVAVVPAFSSFDVRDEEGPSTLMAAVAWMTLPIWWAVYFWSFERVLNTTPGLAAYRLKVTGNHDRPSILRQIASIVMSVVETFPVPLLSIIYIPLTLENRRVSGKLGNKEIGLMQR